MPDIMMQPVGLILAGGRGRRMGNRAKAALPLGDTTLLERAVSRLDPQVAEIAISTNEPLETPLPQLPDTLEGHLGPLAGILAGLDWAHARGATHMVSVAVDTPFFPCDLVPQLLLVGDQGLAIAATSDGQHGTFGLWPVAARTPLLEFLNDGGRKVRDFTTAQNARLAVFPDTSPPAFFNINTPDDLKAATAWI